MSFAEFLKSKRKQRKVTQQALADYLGVTKVYIHQLETGKADAPGRERCKQIARRLRLNLDETWKRSRKERLRKFFERENMSGRDGKDFEVLADEERLLLNLYRFLDDEGRKDFNGMVFMLFKPYENADVRKTLEEFLKCA